MFGVQVLATVHSLEREEAVGARGNKEHAIGVWGTSGCHDGPLPHDCRGRFAPHSCLWRLRMCVYERVCAYGRVLTCVCYMCVWSHICVLYTTFQIVYYPWLELRQLFRLSTTKIFPRVGVHDGVDAATTFLKNPLTPSTRYVIGK